MSSPMNRQEIVLATVAGHLRNDDRADALRVVQNLISVNPASPHQARVNGGGWEIEIDSALSGAYALPNLGASDRVFTNDQERRWLGRLRKHAVKVGVQVVRKWQNRLVFSKAHDRPTVTILAAELSAWIVDDFARRHVTEVEQATLTLVGEREPITCQERWHVYLDDGREVTPSGRDYYPSFLDAVWVAQSIKEGVPGARYAKRPLLWGTI